jgi:hypothetical protein
MKMQFPCPQKGGYKAFFITYKGKCPSLLAHLLWFSQVEAATNWYNALNEGRRKKEEGRRKKFIYCGPGPQLRAKDPYLVCQFKG